MNKLVLHIVIFCCLIQQFHSQEGAVVAFDLPVRNSMRFNRYAIHPTFSFVKELDQTISFTNKRQWTGFEDAPQTYLFSYSGKVRENMGLGIGLFQQDYGVMTTFGGLANYAYSIPMGRESNLTFGLNAGFYSSGINEGAVVTNFEDPALNKLSSNSLIFVTPGINYGTEFFDFGASINNLALYNLSSSELIQENPEQSIQGHVMYTGYINAGGFFDQSRFSALATSEFAKENTIISGLLMLSVPKGIWGQAGYNTKYGVSGGVGINITLQIAIEYNFERSMGDFADFGNSHEITLAYRFKRNTRINDRNAQDETSIFSAGGSSRSKSSKNKIKAIDVEAKKASLDQKRAESQLKKQQAAELKAQEAAAEKARQEEAAKKDREMAEARAAAEAESKAAQQEELEAKAAEAARLKVEEEAAAKSKAAAQAKIREAAQARQKAEAEAAAEAQRIAREEAQQKAKEAAEAKAIAEAAALKKSQEEAEAKVFAEAAALKKAQEAAKAKAQEDAAAEKKAMEDALAAQQAKDLADAKAREAAAQKAIAEAEALAQKEAEEKAQLIANNPIAKSIDEITSDLQKTTNNQKDLVDRLQEKIAIKRQDLRDMKQENDLSEQGVYTEPKPFKSLTQEKNEINALKNQLDQTIEDQRIAIENLEDVMLTATKRKSGLSAEAIKTYTDQLSQLKANQLKAINTRAQLEETLADIEADLEIERKRRIKRAAYDNELDRYNKDRAQLKRIKEVTPVANIAYTSEDFDYGDTKDKIQILNNVNHVESGYYSVLAIHSDEAKRDEFVKKVVASGDQNVDFFYDVKTSKYYIYSKKHYSIDSANDALKTKGDKPYNGKMSIIKIEN